MQKLKTRDYLSLTYIMVALYSFHNFLSYFTFSNFLDQYFSKVTLSMIFAGGSFLAILLSNFLGNFIKKYSNSKALATILIGQIITTIILALSNSVNIVILMIFAILYLSQNTLLWVAINVFIEEFSSNKNTGSVRGTILTIYNFQSIIAPFLVAHLLDKINYTGVFLISTVTLSILFYLNNKYLKEIKEPDYEYVNLFKSFTTLGKSKFMREILASSFALNTFFAVINIYLVLYLVDELGVSAAQFIGIITPISLIPFVILPYQLGKYSDRIFGNKKLMSVGISVFSLTLISIYLFNITSTNIILWILLLFIARLGATITETENYAHFYRRVDSKDAGLIALFQNMSNIGFLSVSLIGALLLRFFEVKLTVIFLAIGIIGILSLFMINLEKSEKEDAINNDDDNDNNEKEENITNITDNIDKISDDFESDEKIKIFTDNENLEKKVEIWA